MIIPLSGARRPRCDDPRDRLAEGGGVLQRADGTVECGRYDWMTLRVRSDEVRCARETLPRVAVKSEVWGPGGVTTQRPAVWLCSCWTATRPYSMRHRRTREGQGTRGCSQSRL